MSDDQKDKAWDVIRASFWLVASIIWAQLAVGIFLAISCTYSVVMGWLPLGSCKDVAPSIMELLVGGLAVALAFSGRAK